MANIPLQSIKFPGLDDTYTVPQLDDTLTQSGGAADAKKVGDEISELKSDFNDLSTLGSAEKTFESGTAWVNNSNVLVKDLSSVRCRIWKAVFVEKFIAAKPGYQISVYLSNADGTTIYGNSGGWVSSFTIPKDYNYYTTIVVRKLGDANISPSEAKENVSFEQYITHAVNDLSDLTDNIPGIEKAVMLKPTDPDTLQAGKLYYMSNNTIINSTGGELAKVTVDPTKDYWVTSSLVAASANFPLIAYFDNQNALIGYEYNNSESVEISIDRQKLQIPDGATWFYVNARNTVPVIFIAETPDTTIAELQAEVNALQKREISILFVGNSLTQDGIAYLPYVLKTYYPDIKFKFYMWYNGGYTLAQQYEKFVADTACEIFSIAENVSAWTNSSKKMSEVLETYTFDIVCMQEYFNYKESYAATDLVDWNNCQNYIQENYTGGNGLEFVSLFHAPLRSKAADVFDMTKDGNGLILQQTIAEDMFANGIAVYRALSTALDSLGDAGHLSPDGTHTQEGLPCLLQTYVALLWLFDKLAINKSIYGLPMRMTTAIYNTLNVPGPNLGTGVITGTDAQNLLAQEVAIKAYKEGKQFVMNNIYHDA